MPTALHELLIELFRSRPDLVAELLAGVPGVELPPHDGARVESGDLTDVRPTEYRADVVVVLTGPDGPVLAVVVEVQLRKDPDKRRSWPVYVTTVQSRLPCPAELLVVCPKAPVARWAAEPIPVGVTGSHITPVVLGPELVPVITEPLDAARRPDLTALSAIAHGAGPGGSGVLAALVGMLAEVRDGRAGLYYELVYEALPAAARAHLEGLMTGATREIKSPVLRRILSEGHAEGLAEGLARALLAVLDAAGIAVPANDRERITSCADTDQLDAWLRRVHGARTVADVLG